MGILTRVGLVTLAAVVATGAGRQTELDRIVSRVSNRIITAADVREARLLRLVADPSSDDSTRKALEDRILILADLARLPPLPAIVEADLTARRAEWESALGGGSKAADLLRQTAMSETTLQLWLRDDVRIRLHLERQFGSLPEPDRASATAEWISRLRQRAGLK